MASFKYLIFIALTVYAVTAEDAARVKKQAFFVAAPSSPVLAYSSVIPSTYSATYPAAYPYAYSAYPSYSYGYRPVASSYSSFTIHPSPNYPSYYANDDGKYWPGKYEKSYYPSTAYHYVY